MIDSGASTSFIDQDFLKTTKLAVDTKKHPRVLETVDGREILGGVVDKEVRGKMIIENHEEEISLDVTTLGSFNIILGLTWLHKHCPYINWPFITLCFFLLSVRRIVYMESLKGPSPIGEHSLSGMETEARGQRRRAQGGQGKSSVDGERRGDLWDPRCDHQG